MKQYDLAFKTLEILADGKFHSGETIAQQTDCSRVSIWKAIAQLKSLGIEIFSVRNKGYRLTKTMSLLNESILRRELGELAQFVHLEFHHVIESTNTYLMQTAQEKPHATVVAANMQTKGKGRRGRIWQSRIGESLTLSILWKFSKGASQLSGLSLVIGIALQRAMRKLELTNTFLKWPNDLLMKIDNDYFKIAGLLIELQGDMESRCTAVIGIGLNYELSDVFKKKIDQPAMGIKNKLDPAMGINKVAALLVKEIIHILSDFDKSDFADFREEWLGSHAFANQYVKFKKANDDELFGIIQDVGRDGSLKILKEDGQTELLLTGELSQA